MPLLQLIVLAAVQGITEFLPISSSGHLILVPVVTGWPDQSLVIDTAVHVGTLGAVLIYFWRDMGMMLGGLWRILRGRKNAGARLFALLVLATVPVVIAGGLLSYFDADDALRSAQVVGWATLVFGIALYAADRFFLTVRRLEQMNVGGAIAIGLAQVLALIPGTSRSGITMTAARVLGFERRDAARFSMLMSIPAIAAAGALKGAELYERGDAQLTGDAVIATALSFVISIGAIALLMAWLRRATFTPFAVYRLGLGVGLLVWVYFLREPAAVAVLGG
jgi:undecaprenyl-diphosphatase